MAQRRHNHGTGPPSGPPSTVPSTPFNPYIPPNHIVPLYHSWTGPEYISYGTGPTSPVSSTSSTIYTPRSTLYLNGRERGTLGAEAVLRARLGQALGTPSQSSNSNVASPAVLTPTTSRATSAISSPGARTPTTSTAASSISSPVVLTPTASTVTSSLSSPLVLTPTASTITSTVSSTFCPSNPSQTLVPEQYPVIPGEDEGLLRQLRELKVVEDRPALTRQEKQTRLERLQQLENQALRLRETSGTYTGGLFKRVCSTDLLFLIDTTGSMAPYIESAKAQVRNILDEISSTFLHQAEVRIAVVGYKDHFDLPNIQFLNFTPFVETVRSFLDTFHAGGGIDGPEDVLGGLQQALKATWHHQTRVIIHIADSPPHGRTLHRFPDEHDLYPNPGSEPHRLTYQPLLKQMLGLKINYVLLRITEDTDRMAYAFLEEYAAAGGDCMLSKRNVNHSKVGGLDKKGNLPTGGLLFREDELGIKYSALQQLVVRSVSSSVMSTATRTVTSRETSRSSRSLGVASSKTFDGFGLPPIREVENVPNRPKPKLEEGPAQWQNLEWFDENISVEGFSIGPTFTKKQGNQYCDYAYTLDSMMESDRYCTISVLELNLRMRKTPFAKGALRLASFARTEASTSRYVVKTFKHNGKHSCHRGLARLAQDMRCQALCKAFALEFNLLLRESPEYAIDFLVSAFFTKKGSDECMSIEPFLDGNFVKYNDNSGYVNQDPALIGNPANQAAQAFSHFTFERSRGRFLVCDLQGVGGMMTDPAVHTVDSGGRFMLSETNLGREGFMFFFAFHECNHLCQRLGLKSNGKMFVGGHRYPMQFTMSFPLLLRGSKSTGPYPSTGSVCCSNKLCGKILFRAAVGMRTKESRHPSYPGYRWCDECLPQLDRFNVRRICVVGKGRPIHEFTVSRFFVESQGKRMPRQCPRHEPRENPLSMWPDPNVAASWW